MKEYNILLIDFVVVNLYLFKKIIEKEDVMFVEVIENIDIGGFIMFCLVVKNYCFVLVVVDLSDYVIVVEELKVDGNVLFEIN